MTTQQTVDNKQNDIEDQVAQVKFLNRHWDDKATYAIPPVCTCCLKPTTNRVKAEWSFSEKYRGFGYVTTKRYHAEMEFNVCEDCVAHERRYEDKRRKMIFISVVLSAIVATVLLSRFAYVLDTLPFIISIILGYVLVPFFFVAVFAVILDFIIPLDALDHPHVSHTKAVRILKPHWFEFDNLAYARLFAITNKGLAQTVQDQQNSEKHQFTAKIKNTFFNYKNREKNLLEGKSLIEIIGLGTAGAAVLTFILTLFIGFALMQGESQLNVVEHPYAYGCCGLLIIFLFIGVLQETKKK